jgi:hypothetical protein
MAHEVIMPALGMAQDTGLIVSWLKNEGDEISVGDAIMEVETDKATMEVEAEAAGFLTNVRAAAGDDVPVGDVVAYISESADEVVEGGAKPEATAAKEEAAPTQETPKVQVGAPKPEPTPAKDVSVPSVDAGDKILASPKAKKLAYEEGLDITQLAAKGVPQPYHVKDLEQLRGVQAVGAGAAASGPQTFHIGASVPRKKVEAFKDWLKADHQTEIENGLIWLGFATSAFRAALESTEKDICVLSSEAGGYVSYLNADRRKLVEITPSESDAAPDFILRDLTETAIDMVQTSAAVCPTLTIARSKKAFAVSLAYQSDQLSDDQAIQFVAEFTARLNEPLRHLL